MELKWLEDFVALARTGSFSRAAQDRHVTQPAFSRRIRALEDWLGVPLFDRTIYPTALTRFGEDFLPHAQDIIECANHIRQKFHMATQSSRKQVKILALHTLSIHLVPSLVADFLRNNKSCSIEIVPSVQSIEAYFNALETGTAHVIVGYAQPMKPPTELNLIEKIVARDRFIPVVARSFFETHTPITFTASRKIPILTYAPFNFSYNIISPILQRLDGTTFIRGESTLGESLKVLVLEGLGVGWLPRYSILPELETGQLVALEDKELEAPFEICAWRREDLDHSMALRLFESWKATR